jgi:hypothetical protein
VRRKTALYANAVVSLNVTRNVLTVHAPSHGSETTRAIVAVCVDGFRVGIMAAGKEEAELRQELERQPEPAPKRGIRAKILAAAKAREDSRSNPDKLQFFRPGEDAWWDRKWQDPDALRAGDAKRAENPRQILLVNPLSAESWSPHFSRGLLMYLLWTSAPTRAKTWPAFRRPKLELHVTRDFSDLEYAELVDQLHSVWGKNRVLLPAEREVPPPPVTVMQVVHRLSRGVFWLAMTFALLINLATGKTSNGVILAVALAAVAVLVRRFARSRMISELPRRKDHTAPPPGSGELEPKA